MDPLPPLPPPPPPDPHVPFYLGGYVYPTRASVCDELTNYLYVAPKQNCVTLSLVACTGARSMPEDTGWAKKALQKDGARQPPVMLCGMVRGF